VEANNGSSGQSLSDFTILELQNKIAALEAEVEKFTSTNTARDEICPSCAGTGSNNGDCRDSNYCTRCEGSGKLSPVA